MGPAATRRSVRSVPLVGEECVLGDRGAGQCGEVDVGVVERGRSLPCGGEQVVEEPTHPGRGAGHHRGGLAPLLEAGLLVGEDRFDVGLDDRDGVAELVGDVGQEPTFGGERAVESVEHAVDGVGQRAELVGWAGRVDPAGQVGGGDLPRASG